MIDTGKTVKKEKCYKKNEEKFYLESFQINKTFKMLHASL